MAVATSTDVAGTVVEGVARNIDYFFHDPNFFTGIAFGALLVVAAGFYFARKFFVLQEKKLDDLLERRFSAPVNSLAKATEELTAEFIAARAEQVAVIARIAEGKSNG